jgi:hypothetical protein
MDVRKIYKYTGTTTFAIAPTHPDTLKQLSELQTVRGKITKEIYDNICAETKRLVREHSPRTKSGT